MSILWSLKHLALSTSIVFIASDGPNLGLFLNTFANFFFFQCPLFFPNLLASFNDWTLLWFLWFITLFYDFIIYLFSGNKIRKQIPFSFIVIEITQVFLLSLNELLEWSPKGLLTWFDISFLEEKSILSLPP